jgi:hypothetical protein
MPRPSKADVFKRGISLLRILLRQVALEPEDYKIYNELIKAIETQAGIAKLDFKFNHQGAEYTTTPMSLNTLKHYSNLYIEGGYQGLDKLRTTAALSLSRATQAASAPTKRTKAALEEKNISLSEKLDAHKKINLTLLHGLSQAIDTINSVRDGDAFKVREKRAKDGIETLRAMVAMNPPPFDEIQRNPVTNIDDYRK